jgi:hypothetical protein
MAKRKKVSVQCDSDMGQSEEAPAKKTTRKKTRKRVSRK